MRGCHPDAQGAQSPGRTLTRLEGESLPQVGGSRTQGVFLGWSLSLLPRLPARAWSAGFLCDSCYSAGHYHSRPKDASRLVSRRMPLAGLLDVGARPRLCPPRWMLWAFPPSSLPPWRRWVPRATQNQRVLCPGTSLRDSSQPPAPGLPHVSSSWVGLPCQSVLSAPPARCLCSPV